MSARSRWNAPRYRLRRWARRVMLAGWAVLEIVGVIGLCLVACLLLALACWVAAAVLLGRALWERATRSRLPAARHDCWFVSGRSVRQVATNLTRDPRFYAGDRVSDTGGNTV